MRRDRSSIEQRAERRFAWLLEDASKLDIASIKNYEQVSANIFEYDPVALTKSSPIGYPWQVLWLMGSHNTKHIFVSNQKPSAQVYSQDALNFINKLKWRVKLRGQEGASIRMKRSRNTAPFKGVTQAPVDHWCNLFRKYVAHHAVKACKQAYGMRCSNMSRLVRNALSIIRSKRDVWSIVVNDKDGGFSIADKSALRIAMHGILETNTYRKTEYGEFDAAQIARDAHGLCKLIAEVEEEPQLRRELSRPVRANGRGKFISRLQVTCKTHKDQGKVSLRPIHASRGYVLAGPGKWLALQIRRRLKLLAPHLLRDAKDAAARMRNYILNEPAKLGKIDLKDFFLSGTQQQLTKDVMELWRDDSTCGSRKREVIKTVLEVLLLHQYVTMDDINKIPFQELEIFAVIIGTGMGLPQSGDIADGAFYIRCERASAGPESLLRHHIPVWLRFRDDILLAYEDFQLMVQFFQGLKASGDYFNMEIEQISSTDINYLNLSVWRNGQRFHVKHAFKPTSLGIPLSASSCHHASVHKSWPAGMVAGIKALSTNDKHYRESLNTFMSRFTEHCTPTLWSQPTTARKPPAHVSASSPPPTLWCPLAFHPGTHRVLQRVIREFVAKNGELTNVLGSFVFGGRDGAFERAGSVPCVQIRLSWYNNLPNLVARMRR